MMPWVLRERPYLQDKVILYTDGLRGLPIDVVLGPGDHGRTILHQMIDALRQEANTRHRGSIAYHPAHAVPWPDVLKLPGVCRLANTAVPDGPAKGKTPLCLLANQCMQGPQYHLACKAICKWLLEWKAAMDFPECPEKSPLMLAVGIWI
jgi:hypothetical protein